jgi:predicted amidohydrolase
MIAFDGIAIDAIDMDAETVILRPVSRISAEGVLVSPPLVDLSLAILWDDGDAILWDDGEAILWD